MLSFCVYPLFQVDGAAGHVKAVEKGPAVERQGLFGAPFAQQLLECDDIARHDVGINT